MPYSSKQVSHKKSEARIKMNVCDAKLLYDPYEGIPIQQYANHIAKLGLQGMFEEFFKMQQFDNVKTTSTTTSDKNNTKNRYKDIPCIDHNRVVLRDTSQRSQNISPLKQSNENNNNDYIHANFVDGFNHRRAYICTQGPLADTTNDFWQMVWQENVLVIVMLTKCFEANKEKCGQYWPKQESKMNQDIKEHREFQSTRLLVTHVKLQKSRIVYHLQYLQWPDHGTPHCSFGFHRFVDEVNMQQTTAVTISENIDQWEGCSHGPPIVVHCSAGIGRTGTLLALDIQRKKLAETGLVDVQNCVKTIRKQRWMSIQKPEQYAFLCLALLEYAHNREMITGLKMNEFFVELVQNCLSEDEDDDNFVSGKHDIKRRKGRRKEQRMTENRPVTHSPLKPATPKKGTANSPSTNSTQKPTWSFGRSTESLERGIRKLPPSPSPQDRSIILQDRSTSRSQDSKKDERKTTRKKCSADKTRSRSRIRKH